MSASLKKDADSATLILYSAIKGYFDGVVRLSGNEATNYKFDALKKSLKEGSFGDVKLNKDHVDAFTKISGTLTSAVTNGYRKRKLAEYVGEANEPIRVLLNAFQFIIVSNLSKKLDVKKQRLNSYYFDLVEDDKLSLYDKKKIIEEYHSSIADLEAKKKQIVTYGKGLKAIADGHQNLYDSRNTLQAPEIKILLSAYASDIQDIVDEFNKLKNEH